MIEVDNTPQKSNKVNLTKSMSVLGVSGGTVKKHMLDCKLLRSTK